MSTPEFDPYDLATIDQEHHIVMGEAWMRLRKNGDFKKIIMESYLKEKVLASVSLLAVPQIHDAGKRPGVFEDLIAASNLQFFFKMIEDFYEGAKNPILSNEEEEALNEAQAEGGMN